MDTLPSELLDEIFWHLDLEDLKTLRRINKALAKHVAPAIFSTVAIWLQKDSVEILVHISQHAHLKEHVKCLRIAFELFLITDEEFNTTYCHEKGLCDEYMLFSDCGSCDCTPMSSEESDGIIQDHKWIDNPEEAVNLLGLALRNLPNLTEVEISGRQPEYVLPHRLISPLSSLYGSRNYTEWYLLSGKRQFNIFMRGVIEAGEKFHLKTLAIRDIAASLHGQETEHLSTLHAGILSPSPEYLETAKLAFQEVEVLIWVYPINARSYSIDQNIALNGFLRAMPNLKELSLSNSSRNQQRFAILDVFDNVTLKDLHSIQFHKMEFRGRELYEFTARFSTSLQFFDMGCARILYPTLKFFLINLRERVALKRFKLYHDICVYTDRGDFKFPLWYGNKKDKSSHATLIAALNDFVTRETDVYPHEILRISMQKNKHQITYDPDADNELVENESEDEGA